MEKQLEKIPVSGLRSTSEPLMRVWVVSKYGQIKTLYHAPPSVKTPFLSFKTYQDNGRVVAIQKPFMDPDKAAEGWSLLEDLYMAEGMQNEWEIWNDYQNKAQALHTTTKFPDEFLPKEVLRRRSLKSTATEWHPPAELVAKKDKAGK